MEEVTVGTLGVDAKLNVAEFERDSGRQLKESADRMGREAGRAMTEGMSKGAGDRRNDFVDRQMGMFRKQMEESRRAAEPVADAVANVGKKSSEASGGVDKISRSLASAASSAARVHPAFGRVADVFRSLAAGGVVSLAIIGGLAAITWAWDKLTEAKTRAREQLESYVTAARSFRLGRETQGDIGLIEQNTPLEVERDRLAAEIRQMQRDIADPSVAQRRALKRVGQDDVPDRVLAEMVEQETQAMRDELAKRVALLDAYTKDIDAVDEALAERIADREERQAAERERERRERIAADKAMYGEARTLLEQWTTSQMTELEKRIALLGRMEAAARLLGDSGATAEIGRQREELEKIVRLYQILPDLVIKAQLVTQGSQIGIDATGRGAKPIMPSAAASVSQIQGILSGSVARLRTQRATGDITSEEMEAGITAAAQRANQALLSLLETWKALGVVPRDVLEVISKALEKNEVETDANTVSLGDYAAAFEGVARGVLGAADAMGTMSDQSRRLFTGLLDVASALQQIDRASKMDSAIDGFAKTIGMIGGVGALIGGALQIGSALFGESPAERERKDVLKRNTEALEDLALELSGFRVTTDVLQRFLGAQATVQYGWIPSRDVHGVAGFANAELRAIEQELGITLFDSKGRLIPGAVQQAKEAIRLQMQNGGITAGGIAPQDRLSVSMTVVQGNQIVNVLTSINDHVRALRAGLVGTTGITLPASAVAGTATSSVGPTITLNGGIQVTVQGGHDARSTGRVIGQSLGDAFVDRVSARYAAAGVVGPIHVPHEQS